ncbi:hypothetical protein [Mycobacteroides abscessus]|uniref:hypothetical protein n=1 Tax=Mycobacteroides abscessus TaxID=36809 RepID=UPI0018966491|nr:hypothetical protein [Mycobacteroides abscessus]
MEIIEVDEAHKDSEFRVAALSEGIEGKRVLYACATWPAAKRAQAELSVFITLNGLTRFVSECRIGKPEMRVKFHSGGEVSFRGADTAGRGYAADVLIMDGLSEIEQCAVLPCVAARDGCVYRAAKGD